MREHLNASEIAKFFKVNRSTVTRWAKKGILKGAFKAENNYQWKIPLSTLSEILKQNQKNKK